MPGWSQPLASRLTEEVRARHPRIRLKVHEAYSGQVEAWLAAGQVQVALFNRYRGGAVRGAERVAESPMMLVGPRGHPVLRGREVALRALQGLPLCGPVQPNGMTSMLLAQAARLGLALDFVVEGNSARLLREQVARCGLFALFPAPFVEREMSGPPFAAARLVRPGLRQATWLAVGSRRPATLAVRTVAGLMRRRLRAA